MNIDETDASLVKGRRGGARPNSGGPRANSGGPRPGSGRPRKSESARVKLKRVEAEKFVQRLEAAAEMEVRVQTAKDFLTKQRQAMKDSGDLDGLGGPKEPEIPKHMLTKNGKLRKFANMYSAGLALVNDPTVSPDTKAKLIIGLTQYEKPRLAEKSLGKKEERQAAAQTAGRSGEFDGLMEPPKGPRLVVNGS